MKDNNWISVKQKLPELGAVKSESVLVYSLQYGIRIGHIYTNNSNQTFWAMDNTLPLKDVTHWQPLPIEPY